MNKNAISIYEAPDMGLLDKKSLKLDAVQVGMQHPVLCSPGAGQVQQSRCLRQWGLAAPFMYMSTVVLGSGLDPALPS